ncbi:MAG TPA: hypothetical protein VNO70_17150 [Blastocatellia bacterium]|nr:hypothetical protein [Blastocatellia bacterium]
MEIRVEQNVFGFHVRLWSNDEDEFYLALEEFKEIVPRNCRRYQAEGKYWFVDLRAERRLNRWLAWAESRFDAQVIDERRRTEYPPTDPMADAYKVLHLLPSAPLPVVQAARKALARLHHPDLGGDAERMKAINNAADAIERQLRGAA